MKSKLLSSKKLFLFDLDGVFYKGKENRDLIGGVAALSHLRSLGKSVRLLTNNSTDTVETIHSRLNAFGIDFKLNEVLSSAYLTAQFVRDKFGEVTYYLVGEEGLDEEMRRFGHHPWGAGRSPDMVVVGLDRGLTYSKLDQGARFLRAGSKLVATHNSRLYMAKDGPAVATGPIVKALEFASGKKAVVVGKPSPHMFRMALKTASCAKKDAVMIGDQLDTDILGAENSGIDAVLVKSGVDRSARGHRVAATIETVDDLVRLV
ncbi:MAG TPA: HAD-IIA family hydrolase [Nitrososphaerales archaeon]|nr:HAD-IIA family hydrolase [Nitrososphaerales archaeon]